MPFFFNFQISSRLELKEQKDPIKLIHSRFKYDYSLNQEKKKNARYFETRVNMNILCSFKTTGGFARLDITVQECK